MTQRYIYSLLNKSVLGMEKVMLKCCIRKRDCLCVKVIYTKIYIFNF